jgi:hypothetical protein
VEVKIEKLEQVKAALEETPAPDRKLEKIRKFQDQKIEDLAKTKIQHGQMSAMLEHSGDIFRELAKPEPDTAYIAEKLGRINEGIKSRFFKTPLKPGDRPTVNKIVKLYESMKLKNYPLLKQTVKLIRAVAGKDPAKIRTNIKEFTKYLQATQKQGIPTEPVYHGTEVVKALEAKQMKQVIPLVTDPKTGGETKTRGLAEGVAEKAVAEGLVKKMEGLPQYETVNLKESAQAAADLVKADPARAKRIAMGEELAPAGVIPELVFDAVERKALLERDVNTINDLGTKSGLLEEATTMGQRLSALQMRDEVSPTKAVKEISRERTKTVKEKLKTKTVEKAKKEEVAKIEKEVKKNTPNEKEWGDFLDTIKC